MSSHLAETMGRLYGNAYADRARVRFVVVAYVMGFLCGAWDWDTGTNVRRGIAAARIVGRNARGVKL